MRIPLIHADKGQGSVVHDSMKFPIFDDDGLLIGYKEINKFQFIWLSIKRLLKIK